MLLAHMGQEAAKYIFFCMVRQGFSFLHHLSTVLTISEGGFIEMNGGKVVFLYDRLFSSVYSWSVVLLAIVSVLYISAMFLTFYAAKARDNPALEIIRKWALTWSAPTIICSVIVFYAIDLHNPHHFQKMLELSWMFVLSFSIFSRRGLFGLA